VPGDDVFFDIFGDGYETPSGLLNSVPSALSRWTVESRLLDGSSVHDCVNSLKPDIIRHLEKLQLVEIQEKMAEEKRKKEESKKAAAATAAEKSKTNDSTMTSDATSSVTSSTVLSSSLSSSSVTTASTTTSTTTTTSSDLSIQPLATITTTIISSSTATPVTSSLESMTRSRRLVSTRLTRQDFSDSNRTRTSDDADPGEQMEVSPGDPHEGLQAPVIPQIPSYETPINPIPDFVPNAPLREAPIITTVVATQSSRATIDSSQPISTILAVSPSRASSMETPHNLPRMNQMRNSNQNALTGGLGLTPQVPLSSVASGNTPRTELPSVAEILATPVDIPSLQQLRSGSLFSQSAQHQGTPSIPPNVRNNMNRGMAPLASDLNPSTRLSSTTSNISDLTVLTTMATTSSIGSGDGGNGGTTSVIAADLAAAIMSQLVTSSPTPSVSTTANTIDSK